jgi:phytoene dehydrogenase-like protein
MRHDAIVVGAGHQGLVAAVRLARAGWRTVVVERNERPGGAVMSAEVTRPGFVHDLFSTNQNLFLASPFYAELRSELERHGLRYAVSGKPYANAFPGGGSLRVYQDAERTVAGLRAHDPGDANGWEALGRLFERFSPALFALYAAPLPSWTGAREALGASRRLRREGLYELVRLLLSSTRDLGDAYFSSREAKAMLACWGMHLDLGPDVSGGAMFPFLETFADQAGGMAVVEGGASRMIDALVGLLREHGGELRTGAEVTRIDVSGGRARGVELAGGERLEAERAVVACVTPTALFGGLVDGRHLPDRTLAEARRYRYGPGTMMLHLALDGPVPWAAGGDLHEFAYVHVAPYIEELAATYTEAMNGLLPAEPLLVVGQTSAVDPTRAPTGQHVLWVQVRALPAAIRGDAAGAIDARTWEEAGGPMADRVMAKLERYAPGLGGRVLERAVLTPADLERHDPNLVGGDSLAGSMHLGQNFLLRPFPGSAGHRTPVEGLYLCGASTWPGAGVNALSGDHAASRALADDAGPRARTLRLLGTR